MLLSLLESMAFGLGVAFLVSGRRLLGRMGRSPRLTTAVLAWFLVSLARREPAIAGAA